MHVIHVDRLLMIVFVSLAAIISVASRDNNKKTNPSCSLVGTLG